MTGGTIGRKTKKEKIYLSSNARASEDEDEHGARMWIYLS